MLDTYGLTDDPAHTFGLWLPPEDYAAVEHIARESGASVTDVVREFVRQGLGDAR